MVCLRLPTPASISNCRELLRPLLGLIRSHVVLRQSQPELVQQHWGLLQTVVNSGAGIRVIASVPARHVNNQSVAAAMVGRHDRERVDHVASFECVFFRHAIGAEELHRMFYGQNVAPQQAALPTIMGERPGLLVDTGAVRFLIGSVFAESQVMGMETHGLKQIWTEFRQKGYMRGVGDGAQICSWKVNVVGVLSGCSLLSYGAPVLDDDPSHTQGRSFCLCMAFINSAALMHLLVTGQVSCMMFRLGRG